MALDLDGILDRILVDEGREGRVNVSAILDRVVGQRVLVVQHLAENKQNTRAAAGAFVNRELDKSDGHFGRFVVQAIRDGLPIRICSSELPSTDKRRGNDWRSFLNYLELAQAYFSYFKAASHPAYKRIPAFPIRDRGWIASLPKRGKKGVIDALVNAMIRPGRTIEEFSRVRRQLSPFSVGSRSRVAQRRRLTMLSMGGGRDSVVLALVLANHDDPWLRRHFPIAARDAKRYRHTDPDLDLLATFSDTGDEFPFTYAVLDHLESYLAKPGDGHTGARHPFQLVRLNKPVDPATGKLIEARVIMQAVRGEELIPSHLTSNEALRNQWWSHGIEGESAFEAAERGKHHLRPPLYLEHVYSGTMTARDNASCTANQKIVVLDRFVQDLASERFGIVNPWRQGGRRETMGPWAKAVDQERVGRHRRLIGIHAGERGRVDLRSGGVWPERIVDARQAQYKPGEGDNPACVWERRGGRYTPEPGYEGACYADATNEYHYPLVDWGIDEADETKILDHYGWGHTRKSGCKACHWASRSWFWGVYEAFHDSYEAIVAEELGNLLRRWVQHEQVRKALKTIRGKWTKTKIINALARVDTPIDLWRKVQVVAGPRGMDPIDLLRAVANGEMALIRPTTLTPRAVLPCEVAYFGIRNPYATIADVFDKTYHRGGGAANFVCPTRLPRRKLTPGFQVHGFSDIFRQSVRT